MLVFDQIYQAAKSRALTKSSLLLLDQDCSIDEEKELALEAKSRALTKISLLLLDQHCSIDEEKELALTPAGLCAKEGDWETAYWLMTECNANVGSILYGGILGGHITSSIPKDGFSKAELEIWARHIRQDDGKMVMGFAQMGNEEALNLYLSGSAQRNNALICDAIKGASYGNCTALMHKLFTTDDTKEYAKQLEIAIHAAACAGNQALAIECMELRKKILPKETEYSKRPQDFALQGAGQTGQLALIKYLHKNSETLGYIDVDIATREAMLRNNDDFVMQLIAEFPNIKHLAQVSAALLQRNTFIEKSINKNTCYKTIAIGLHHWAFSESVLMRYLAQFNDSDTVKNLTLALTERKEINPSVSQALPKIAAQAQAVIKLKQAYNLATKQALLLQENPKFLARISKQEDDDALCRAMVGNEEGLNNWQLKDLIKKVRKNAAKAELIYNLENYQANKSRWWYNHLERCEDFLSAIKETRKSKVCNKLIADQYRLFHPAEGASDTESGTAKHLQPVKQEALKDDFYRAIKKYYDSVFCPQSPA